MNNLASIVGAGAGAGVGYFLWAPVLDFSNPVSKVIVALPLAAIGGMAADDGIQKKTTNVEISLGLAGGVMISQYLANWLLKPYMPADDILRALLLGPTIGVVGYALAVVV